jgi:hypothetical protein
MLIVSCGSDDGSNTEIGDNPTPVAGNIVFTSAWKGEWQMTIVFEDCADGDTLNIDNIVDVICAGDTLDLQLTDLAEDCSGTMTDTRLMVNCTYQFTDGGCTVDVVLTLEIERQGDTLVGSGQWSATATGLCPTYIDGCEDLVISGTRLQKNPAECNSPQPLNVVDRFGLTPRLFVRPYTR